MDFCKHLLHVAYNLEMLSLAACQPAHFEALEVSLVSYSMIMKPCTWAQCSCPILCKLLAMAPYYGIKLAYTSPGRPDTTIYSLCKHIQLKQHIQPSQDLRSRCIFSLGCILSVYWADTAKSQIQCIYRYKSARRLYIEMLPATHFMWQIVLVAVSSSTAVRAWSFSSSGMMGLNSLSFQANMDGQLCKVLDGLDMA